MTIIYHDARAEKPRTREDNANYSVNVLGWVEGAGWRVVYYNFRERYWLDSMNFVGVTLWVELPQHPFVNQEKQMAPEMNVLRPRYFSPDLKPAKATESTLSMDVLGWTTCWIKVYYDFSRQVWKEIGSGQTVSISYWTHLPLPRRLRRLKTVVASATPTRVGLAGFWEGYVPPNAHNVRLVYEIEEEE